ncbi:ArsC family reductase [Marinomonas sp. M1K-6]|uniref:ArsC family reductase n=1 Tax=Marinomonas profundi TaxID=2726122 RepID=A0A847QXA3_9GAMM|nr:ArsC family reductase [Marinomonas profundi]NLQ18218.1 ArsC family reductase [Marinomonas profundi]UDV03571.1 ArsC family reductase [Marinomonas profundi]
MITLFGIKNCDTMKKAFRWFDDNNLEYAFHDYKKAGLDEATAKTWVEKLGWENVINKRGTTWRKLEEETKRTMNNDNAIDIMISQPSIIKRPLLIIKQSMAEDVLYLGFNAEEYAQKLL